MSLFKVSLEVIEKVWPHTNADRLELAKVVGIDYQFVVVKGTVKAGTPVIYFPIDSIIPERILKQLGLVGKLAGKELNRVKTVKLRGKISQGLVALPDEIDTDLNEARIGADLAESLGVTKYEPPVIMQDGVQLTGLSDGVSSYEIESIQHFPNLLASLQEDSVHITEKVEGYHWMAIVTRDYEALGYVHGLCTIQVAQHNYVIDLIADKPNKWHDAFLSNYDGILSMIDSILLATSSPRKVIIRGEIAGPGIMGNIYKLDETRLFTFDAKADGHYLNAINFRTTAVSSHVPVVPSIFVGKLDDWLKGRTLVEASNGKSKINPEVRREGIVIRPMRERHAESIGRIILKVRSPEYLAGSKL